MEWIRRIVTAVRLARSDTGLWLGEIDEATGEVRAVRLRIEQAPSSHFNHRLYGDKRWRLREDSSETVFWWSYADVTDAEKRAVERWLAKHGIRARRHVGRGEQIEVEGVRMWAAEYAHGGGPPRR